MLFLGEHDVRGLSVSRLMRVKARILAKYLVEVTSSPMLRRRRLERVAGWRGEGSGRSALVLGLGPSIRKLDGSVIARCQAEERLSVVAVNAFAQSDLAQLVTPDIYVLTDPAFFGGDQAHYVSTSRGSPDAVWDYLAEHGHVRVAIPHNRDARQDIDDSRVVYLNGLGLQGFSRNTSPLRARGYLSITAYAALGLAGYMGFDRILLSGIDNSQFLKVSLSSRQRVAVGASHAYNLAETSNNEIDLFARGGMAAYFEDVSRLFHDLHLFNHLRVENLDASTLVDAFPVATDWRRFTLSST